MERRVLTPPKRACPAVVRQNQRFVLERAGGPDEAYFTYAFSPVRDAAGAVVAVHNASTETTAQIVAERQREAARDALAGERARLADIVRIAPAFMAVLRGPDHVIELTNAGYDALAGRRDVRGRPVAEALPEAAAQGFVALLDRVLATGEPFIGREVPYRRPDGAGAEDERFIDFVYQALTEADGTRSGVFVHGVDVTEQVRARREVERLLAASERARAEADAARRAAEAANRAKGDFLATMSHEIRTPINAALGYAELMQLGLAGPVTEQQKEYLGRLRLSSQHLLGLVNEVLDLSKAEAGQMTVAHEPAMTGEAIAAATALTLPLADTKGVRLVDRRPGEPGVPYVGDEQRVRQILVNLLSNAVKFTPPGGVVTVACDTAREAALAGAPSGPGPWAYIRVEDTGMGIAPEEQERVFDPFVQAEPGLTRTAGGTGLGLTISRRLARLMGGDLTVESRPGAGSAFTLWLPTGGADAARAAPSLQPLRDAPPRPEGLAAAGAFLRERLERVLEDYVERVRRDPTLPPDVRTAPAATIEDHGVTFLGDLAQSLVAIEQTGGPQSDILRDGTEIQRVIAQLHGQQRHRLGWSEAQLARDFEHLTGAVDAMLRRRVAGGPDEVETAVRVLRQLIAVAAAAAGRAFRHASQAEPPPDSP